MQAGDISVSQESSFNTSEQNINLDQESSTGSKTPESSFTNQLLIQQLQLEKCCFKKQIIFLNH